MVNLEDNLVLKMVEKRIKYNGEWYEVAIPWKKHWVNCLLDIYSDANKWLHHIEKPLSKKSKVCKGYEETINQYITNGYKGHIRQEDTTKGGSFPHISQL